MTDNRNKRYWGKYDIYPLPSLKYYHPKYKEPEYVTSYKVSYL